MGVDRLHIPSGTWLSPWTSSNWLDANEISKLIVIDNYAYVVSQSKIQRYDSNALAFTGDITSSQANLTGFEKVFPGRAYRKES